MPQPGDQVDAARDVAAGAGDGFAERADRDVIGLRSEAALVQHTVKSELGATQIAVDGVMSPWYILLREIGSRTLLMCPHIALVSVEST